MYTYATQYPCTLQTDVQTLLHYAVMVRDVFKDKDRSDHLLAQAAGEWHLYTNPGMVEPARDDELCGKPKVCACMCVFAYACGHAVCMCDDVHAYSVLICMLLFIRATTHMCTRAYAHVHMCTAQDAPLVYANNCIRRHADVSKQPHGACMYACMYVCMHFSASTYAHNSFMHVRAHFS